MIVPPSDDVASRHVVEIFSVPYGESSCVIFAGPLEGLNTHWAHGKSVSCPGEERCITSVHRTEITWKGYSPGHWWSARAGLWIPAVLEVTEALEPSLRGRVLSGEMWLLTRSGSKRRPGPVSGVYIETRDDQGLRRPFPLLPILQRRYHTLDIVLGMANTLPARTLLPTVSAPPPFAAIEERPQLQARPTADQIEALRKLSGRSKGPLPASPTGAPQTNGKISLPNSHK